MGTDQDFFNFMGVFRKSIKYIGSVPTFKELAPPPTTSAGSAPVMKLHTVKLNFIWSKN